MLVRAVVVLGVALAMAGCASERPTSADLVPGAATGASAAAPASAIRTGTISRAEAATFVEPGKMPKKTMADRVLTAIALERVTGLKPDPSRLTP